MTRLNLTQARMNRRDALASLLAISASGALAACGNSAEVPAAERPGDVLRYAKPTRFFSDAELAKLSAIADTIIPPTDTPGAVEAGVPGVIQKLASEWGDDNFRQYWREGIASVSKMLSDAAGSDFAALSAADRETALSAFDTKAYAGEIEAGFYRDMKKTVATAYYMSEPGATQELAYEAVPGEWIGQAPISEYPKTWAT